MTQTNVYQDAESGQWAVDLDDGTTMLGDDPVHLANMVRRHDEARARPARFLAAWKKAVVLAGPRFFDVLVDDVAAADDKNQLRPNPELIADTAGVLSSGERVFLLALVCLFNSEDAMALCQRYGEAIDPRTLADTLDYERLGVLVNLMQNYAGW